MTVTCLAFSGVIAEDGLDRDKGDEIGTVKG